MAYKESLVACVVLIAIYLACSSRTYAEAANCTLQGCMEAHNTSADCHCDGECGQRDDCCDDYVETCLSQSQDKCYGRCFAVWGFIPNQNCYCDDLCSKYRNCCPDFIQECANETKCEGRCFASYDSSKPCQCNDKCRSYGNCCEDYDDICLPGTCEDRCGTRNETLGCKCDEKCAGSNLDCCKDYYGMCTKNGSCSGLCGADYDSTRTCQCTSNCKDYGNCCGDYEELCKESYTCNGKCNTTKTACSCEESCEANQNCCTDYVQSCKGGTSWLEDECTPEEDMTCPEGFDLPPVILFSIDGFRESYIYRHLTPNLWKLASCGVHAPYLRSVYPTLTFPNHYSIATGLYPESHGIVGNRMYDHDLKEEFRLGGSNAFHSYWWGGEPIWVTTSNQGLKSASYFWVGSDVNITRYPDYYYTYDGSVPNEERIYQALRWLDMPKADRPSIMTLYMDIVDHAGHNQGPEGEEVDVAIADADTIIGMLMDGLKARNLDKCVNLIILADHGMANTDCERLTYIDQYGIDLDNVYFRGGAHGRVGKSDDETLWDEFDAEDVQSKLECKHQETHFQSFLKYEYLPKRLHYAYNKRIEDVHLLVDNEWLVAGRTGTYTSCDGGTHGWDNEYKQMHAVFLAHGSGFKRAYNSSMPFENIEVYNLLTDLLDITPAPNNGTSGALYHIQTNPKQLANGAAGESAEECLYPTAGDTTNNDMDCNICEGEAEMNQNLDLTPEEVLQYNEDHMLRGTPHISSVSGDDVRFCILTHRDYVTIYDWNKKMPLLSAFVLDREIRTMDGDLSCLRPDIRINSQYQTACSQYDGNSDITAGFLYWPYLSSSAQRSDAKITSNVIPVYNSFMPIWERFAKVLYDWAGLYNGVSVITGPVFDYDFDGRADSMKVIRELGNFVAAEDSDSTPIPTHIFAVITRCRNYDGGQDIRECAKTPDDIEVISFVIPNFAEDPCYKETMPVEEWVSDTLFEHVARVRDVELLTGINFFTDWTADTSADQATRVKGVGVKLRLPQFLSEWMKDFIENATPDPSLYMTMTTQSAKGLFSTTTASLTILTACLLVFRDFF